MSNDPKRPGADLPEPLSAHAIPRRTILKYAGAGLAVAALPSVAGCAVDADAPTDAPEPTGVDEAAIANATWVTVMRKEDLVVLQLGFVNLDVRSRKTQAPPFGLTLAGDLYLARTNGRVASYILVGFQSQHILEEAFDENGIHHPPAVGSRIPVDARMASASRLVFLVPAGVVAIPYELDKLLGAIRNYQLNVAANALPEAPDTITLAPIFGTIDASPGLTLSASEKTNAALRATRVRKANLAFSAQNGDTVAAVPVTPPVVTVAPPTLPEMPGELHTSIELPFRLQISPNKYAKWDHATTPVTSPITQRTELWHTRLGTGEAWQKTIRALWTRDAHFDVGTPDPNPTYLTNNPFYADLGPQDRGDLVHLTTNYTLTDANGKPRARAVDVSTLMLSSLGGWMDAHGKWADGSHPSVVAWDHLATMGRDQKVRIVRVGYLYPFGHKAVWVRVTERKFHDVHKDTAYLWSREFIVVKELLKTYDGLPADLGRGFPFKSVRFKTVVTPSLFGKGQGTAAVAGLPHSSWALLDAQRACPFDVQAFDHDGNACDFTTACIWVDADDASRAPATPNVKSAFESSYATVAAAWANALEAGKERRRHDLRSQRVAFAPSDQPDDARYATTTMAHTGVLYTAQKGAPFVPQLDDADLAVDTIRGLTGTTTPTRFKYTTKYRQTGFNENNANPGNAGNVFLELATGATAATLGFSKQSHKSGGFVAPNLNVTALSRSQGIIAGDPDTFASGTFNPASFLDDIGAKLFGVVPLSAIIAALGLDGFFKQAPKFLTQAVEDIEVVIKIVQSASDLATTIKDEAASLQALTPYLAPGSPPPPAAQKALFERLKSKAGALDLTIAQLDAQAAQLATDLQGIIDAASALATAIGQITAPNADLAAVATAVGAALDSGRTKLVALATDLKTLALPINAGTRDQMVKACTKITQILPDAGTIDALVQGFVNAEEAIKNLHVKLEWSPEIAAWPAGAEIFWPNDKHGFHLGVEVRGKESGGQPAGADVYASLVDFELRLIGDDPFLTLVFDKLQFKAGTKGKPEIDCVFRGLHFLGPLSFIETLRNFIPLDGFSDPPNVSVTTEGLSANFTLPLPNIAVGIFSLENLSFSAGFNIPFIGKSLDVSFKFCSRESPFVLTVAMLGGGGFVGITLTPDGVRLLEISLEAQACLALDFGVASGSVSIAVGIYFAIENGDCTLSGYVRIRGCVDVLGIIKASIELKMELTYESATGKVIGRASLEIEVSILCFSVSVSISVERKFKGANNDPTFRQIMAYDPSTSFQPWEDYVDAFVPVAA